MRTVCRLLCHAVALMLGVAIAGLEPRAARAEGAGITLDRDESILLGRQILTRGRPEIALALARALVERDARDADALVLLAAALQHTGAFDEARAVAHAAYAAADTDEQRFEAAMLAGRSDFHRGAHSRAQLWLRRAAHSAPDAEAREAAERNFNHARRANPLDLRASLGITASSNINDGTSTEVIDLFGIPFRLQGASRALSGIEFALDMRLRYRIAETARSNTALTAALSSRSYRLSSDARAQAPEARASDYAFQSAEVGIVHRMAVADNTAVHEIAGRFGRSWYGGDPLSDFAQLELSRMVQLRPGTSLRFALSGQHQRRHDSAARSATVLGAQVEAAHVLDSGANLLVMAAFRQTDAQASHVRNTAQRALVSYTMAEPVAGMRLTSSVDLEQRRFPADAMQPDGRRDLRGTLGLSASFETIEYMGFSPSLNVRYSRTRSNVAVHERRSIDVFMGVNSRF